ncbi:MAG: RDD family protein [Bacteroidota bacterium]
MFQYITLVYNVVSDFLFQRSIGKKLAKIKVVDISGKPPTLFQAFTRNFGKIISTLPLMWGFIRVLTPTYRQTIHDELSRCLVIEE